jgi:uncharacterized membrane protein
MRTQLLKYWDRIRSSFWFLPMLMTMGSVVLAYFMVSVDRHYSHELPAALSWAYTGGAEGASAVLGTIAGSMITLAGVVFSLTLVALSLASSQFGPRLLRNFMRDTSNQVTIGTFIATFLYCLLVLRTIRRLDDSTFVPQISVTVGVAFALASLGVLIYFIHHVAVSIQADEIIARVAGELEEGIERLFPEHLGADVAEEHEPSLPADFRRQSVVVCSSRDGYLEIVDAESLMAFATEHDLIMHIERRPGHYVIAGTPLLHAYPMTRVSDALCAQVQKWFVLGSIRTSAQDLEFSLNQLVEVAARALSPGVNDPFTAITCIDRLGSALKQLATRRMPSSCRRDADDVLRIIAPGTSFPRLLAASFDQIRQYGASSVAVTIRLLEILGQVATFAHRAEDIEALQQQAEMIMSAARRQPFEQGDRNDIEERSAEVVRVLSGIFGSSRGERSIHG